MVTKGGRPALTEPIFFMNRHGKGHSIPPHLVNYRANIWALHQLGVQRILATAAVGSLNVAMAPGQMVLADQFLDFTKTRASTFFEGGTQGVVHTDMTVPYCPDLRIALHKAGHDAGLSVTNGGVYVATEGPRFESPAEIRAYRLLGGDLVGMTGVPEVVLARELGMCYASIGLVTNFAAGISASPLTHQEVLDVMADNVRDLRQVIERVLPQIMNHGAYVCVCQQKEDESLGKS